MGGAWSDVHILQMEEQKQGVKNFDKASALPTFLYSTYRKIQLPIL
jgi:hypothetical protein